MISNGGTCNVFFEKSFTCYKCKKSFPSEDEVVMHLKLIHNACATPDCKELSDFKLHSSVCDNRGFGCPVCDEKFSEKYALQIHFNEHIGVAFYVCEICRSGFQQRKLLQRHLLATHHRNISVPVTPSRSKTMYQKCVHCSKYFKLFSEFENHKSLCSSFPYTCDICKVNFASAICLEKHKSLEHKDAFPVRGYLALKDGKRYYCGVCYLGFFKGSVLKKHLETHETEDCYVCDVCHLSFVNDDTLQEHYLQHIEEHYVLHDVIQQHSCVSCKRLFMTLQLLENHLVSDFCTKEILENNNSSVIFYNNASKSVVKNVEKLDVDLTVSAITNQSDMSNGFAVTDSSMLKYSQPPLLNSENTVSNSNVSVSEVASNVFDISHFPVYILKSGDELLNCDDGDCVVVMDKKSLFVLQKGICASESRMPDLSNCQIYDDDDNNIDISLLENHMHEILKPVEINRCSAVEHSSNSEILNDNALNARSEDIECISNSETVSSKDLYDVFSVTACNNSEIVNDETLREQNFISVSKNLKSATKSFSDTANNNIVKMYETGMNLECGNSKTIDIEESKIMKSGDKWIDQDTHSSDKKCDESFKKIMHIETMSSFETHVCNICQQVFSSKTSLCFHMKGSHTGFDCYSCGLSFSTADELLLHKKISHHSSFHCNKCEVAYPKEYLLKKHKSKAHGVRNFVCHNCDKSYVLKTDYEIHMMLHENGTLPLKCDKCGKVYASVSSYMRHRALHEGKNSKKKYICNICDTSFIASFLLRKHIGTHMKKSEHSYECPKCKMYFSQKMITKHINSHETVCMNPLSALH